ncbi:MAG: leucine-rich repeat protein [Bacteroidales bacterium]|nr:leucine-rich repeat protein [Bacteroidales bacterium]
MKHPLFLLTALAMLVASCTIDIDTNMQLRTDEATVFYATIEGSDTPTKVFADENLRVLWNQNDDISIFNRTTGNQLYRFFGRTGANAGTFNPVSGNLSSTPVDHIYALYPYDEATTLNANGVVSLTLPATQTYKENSFGIGANTMLSVSDNNQLMFRNVGGYLAFKFYGDNVKVKSITLRGNNHEKLAGPATVTMPVNGIPTLQMEHSATENITLACETPVTLSTDENNPTLFWFVLPPTDFTEGITVTVIDDQGGIFVKSSANPFSITRSNLRRMGVMAVVPTAQTPPDNEIWYTTIDGEVLVPEDVDAFGSAAIVSNTYENGKGIISFDKNLTEINSYAFWGCERLATISLPETVTELEPMAFVRCLNLSSFTGAFATSDGRALVSGNTLLAFAPAGLTSYTIDESVEMIAGYTFAWISDLTKVILPAGLTEIGGNAFSETGLTSIHIPDQVTAIDAGAFFKCANLSAFSGKFATADGRALITDEGTFWGFAPAGLSTYSIPEGVTYLYPFTIGSDQLRSITLPESLLSIGWRGISSCPNLTGITVKATDPPHAYAEMFPSTNDCPIYVPAASVEAYKNADYWSAYAARIQTLQPNNEIWYTSTDESVVNPYKADVFGVNIVSNTYQDGLGIIQFDGPIQEIGSSAFFRCYKLQTVRLPEGLETIGTFAFEECKNLTSITLPNTLTTLSQCAFESTGLTTIHIPESVVSISPLGVFSGCNDLASFTGKYISDDGRSLIDGSTLLAIAPAGLEVYTIPCNVNRVPSMVIAMYSDLKTLIYPATATTIGQIYKCTGLDSVIFEATTPPTIKIGGYFGGAPFRLFLSSDNCTIYVPAEAVEAYRAAEYWSDYAARIQPLDEVQPDNEIWYTSTGGMVVNPYDPEAFGVNIVSNTYQNGKGILVFDQPLTKLGFEAFKDCENLLEISLPDGIQRIDRYAFMSCTALQAFHSNLASDDGRCLIVNNTLVAFAPANVTEYEIPGGINRIQGDTFWGCQDLTAITIPEGVTELGTSCFYCCTGLEEIHLPQSLKIIGDGALSSCESLTEIQLPTSLTTIDENAFMDCNSLQTIDIPNSVTSLGESAFGRCSSLQSFTGRYATNDHLALIDGTVLKAFALGSNVKEYTVPAGVKTIGAFAFSTANLDSILLPDGLEEIGWHSFSFCTAKKLEFPSSLTRISGYGSLSYCPNITEFTFNSVNPPTLARAGMLDNTNNCPIYVPAGSVDAYKAAQYWSDYAARIQAIEVQPDNEIWYTSTDGNIVEPNLTDYFDASIVSNTYENGKGVIKFDRDLTRIGDYAFARCYTLQTMQLPASITYIGSQAFTYCHQLQSMHIPDNVVTISYRCFSCCPNLSAFSGKFATADGRCLIHGNEMMAFAPQGLTSYVIDDGVEIISFSVFEECSSLTSITLPDGLLELKAEAFDGCSGLTALTLPSSLERIGPYAFTYTGLSTINIPSNVTTIGRGAFARCSALASFSGKFASADGRSLVVDNTLMAVALSGLTQFTVPDGISAVASETFSYCQNLTSIVFPSTVSTINESAVNYCTGLTGITVQATTPPDCTFDMFPESNNCPIYVPSGSVEAYKAAQYWSYYAERIQAIPE